MKYSRGDEVIPASAKHGHGVDDGKEILLELLVGSSYYSKVHKDLNEAPEEVVYFNTENPRENEPSSKLLGRASSVGLLTYLYLR